MFACVCVLAAQSSPTLCNLMNCRPQNSSVQWISQERILEWVVISCPRASSQPKGEKKKKNRFPALTEGFFIIWATKKAWEPLKLNYIFSVKRSIYEFRRSLPWIISELTETSFWKSLVRCSHFLTNKYWCSPMLFSPL